MALFFRRSFGIAVLIAGFAVAAVAGEPAIVDRARAFVGTELALQALNAVRFVGTIASTDPADPTKSTRVSVEIVFQHPSRQWLRATSAEVTETTVLDGYEGWKRIESLKDAKDWRQISLGLDVIRRMRATTWEALSFWRGIEAQGGRAEDEGTATVEGVACQKVAFTHYPGFVYHRFFDVATGRLVLTETESGDTIREQGEMVVEGIRFPRRIVTTSKNKRGQESTATMTFEQITINEPLADEKFRVPLLKAR